MYTKTRISTDIKVEDYVENYVDVDKYLQYCKNCSAYNSNWSCPPFDFNPLDIWNSFNDLKIEALKIDFSEDIVKKTFSKNGLVFISNYVKTEKDNLKQILYNYENQYKNSLALFFGQCDLCDSCSRKNNNECLFPDKSRYSIESLGGNVDQFIEDTFGYKILWVDENKVPEYLIYVGGLLYNKK